ncbi:MAG: 2,3,4,5-tetrahydropyridine-2,6-dicarboxylate N-succinyltransferase [Candidatus Nanopelagicus sp.]|jgi:2,3,4,5-tetrahydropyridine-2-carboxylate N-succinyltransferase|nr:2,3,4,5-tetrahydropyridine-2,6-dicarboxylate N-succinyltransferase [Candidatus Nanopelagicus sp.]
MSANQSTAYGFGIATQNLAGSILESSFYELGLGNAPTNNMDSNFKSLIGEDPIRKVKKVAIEVIINLNDKPKDAADVYLRLHLLSHRLVKPHGVNLDGIFSLLANVVWTSAGACEVEGFEKVRPQLLNKFQNLTIYGVDKFPRMVDYVIPAGVRIADGDRVRLGAYLSSGTTVMHEGFVNFNAGTLGKSMVEGRISAGVVVGDGSDIGGGASIMGTLSGGGKEVISIGERTLLGANSGIGISLGNDCVVEAGIYVTAGSKITLPDGKIVKAKELSGANNLLFRRNSQTGSLEVLPKTGSWSGLNSVLHKN